MGLRRSLYSVMDRQPRWRRQGLVLISDACAVSLSLCAAYLLRFGDWSGLERLEWWLLAAVTAGSLPLFYLVGLYRSLIRHIGSKAITNALKGVTASSLLLVFLSLMGNERDLPRSIPFIYWLCLFIGIGGPRFIARAFILSIAGRSFRKEPVVIYGAGAAGIQLASALQSGHDYTPIAFVDDSLELQGAQIARLGPKTLIGLDMSELAIYQIEQTLSRMRYREGLDITFVPLMGSVLDREKLEAIMQGYGVETVYHAAAYKHVPLVEFNVIEGTRNNVMGTKICAEAAAAAGVELFVLISTDKAVRPTNVMGASKRLAEELLQSMQGKVPGTRFVMVRFGNVLGSSGSVVPLFQEQILAGGPVTVTHPEITRYFMTIAEAGELVLQAGSMGQGGEVFLLDMGEPVKIDLLARRMIHLMGHDVRSDESPAGDIEIVYTGLRPGEKLFEELLIGGETLQTEHPRIFCAKEAMQEQALVERAMAGLQSAIRSGDVMAARQALCMAVPGYLPSGQEADLTPLSRIRDEGAEKKQSAS